jgi:pimeloyl-ACP methyl ester carboxylesterase
VILFDQRGTGEATPNLDCPEMRDPTLAALGAAGPPLDERSKLLEALRHCRLRLVDEGVDLRRFTTTETADDVADLKRALGITTWNLFGVSYGTTVALEMMRRHPEGVRSVVLDSVLPTTVPGDAQHQAAVVHRALRALFDGCALDAGCNAAYPDLSGQLDKLVDAWNKEPFESDATSLDGQPHHLAITGYDTVAGLWNAMYETDLIPLLPSVIHQLPARGDFATAVVSQLANDGLHQLVGAAEGMQMSVDCADRQRLAASTDDDVIAGDPDLTSFFTLSVSGHCELWDVPSVPAAFNRAVRSDLAALVLGDEYDPITPPAQSRRVADALGDATFVQLPGLGHGAVFSGQPCPVTIFQSFLTSPGHADTSCAAGMDPPHWVLPS